MKLCWREVEKEAAHIEQHGYDADYFDKLKNLSIEEKKQLALSEIGLSTRIINSLENNFDILFVKQLLQLRRTELMATPNMGEVSIAEIFAALKTIGITNEKSV